MSKLPVCPHCGSRKVVKIDDFLRCDDCNQDFGRTATSDDGVLMVDAVKGLRFRYGDYFTGSVILRIAEDTEAGAVLFEVYDSQMHGTHKVADLIDKEEWMALKKKLFEDMYVADWYRVYYPVNDGKKILDNNSWELDLIVSDTEVLVSKGYSIEPVKHYWKKLLDVMEPYFNRLAEE